MGYLVKRSRSADRRTRQPRPAKLCRPAPIMAVNAGVIARFRDHLLLELQALGAHTYCFSRHASTYIRFRDHRLGSLRIADHPGRESNAFRWNLDVVAEPLCTHDDRNGMRCYYFGPLTVDELVASIKEAAAVLNMEADDVCLATL